MNHTLPIAQRHAPLFVVLLIMLTACGRTEVSTPTAGTPNELAPVVGGLQVITVVTADVAATQAYFENFNLRPTPPDATDPVSVDATAQLWGVSSEIAAGAILLANPTDPQAPRVRLLSVAADQPLVRPDRTARRDGGLSVGFACAPKQSSEPQALQPTERLAVEIARPDGAGTFVVEEAYYAAPDNVVVPCITRPADLPPLAPIDAATGIGGPAYSGIVVANVEQEVAFYSAVLGLEQRRDLSLTDPKLLAVLGLPADAKLRLVQLFAPGTSTGFLTLLDPGTHGERNEHVRPPARGVAIWTFRVHDLLEVRRKLKEAHGVVVAGPVAARSARWGDYQAMTALTPAGTFLELVEVKSR